ncbi:MAG TPA: 3'(2'),5'-bisphosphate nucleotidase CysQ [Candidatus Limnocylindrales bacterium]
MIDVSLLDLRTATDARLAAALAAGAGERLLDLRQRMGAGAFDEAELRRAGDRVAQEFIAERLAALRPDDSVLSEEAADDRTRLEASRVWIVDPLDGTREFSERNADGSWRDDFAVHVALWQRGLGLTDGAVALPARDRTYASDLPTAPTDPGTEAVVAGRRTIRIAASRTRPPAIVGDLADAGQAELVPMGSCGVKAIAVLEGEADAYVHAGGQFEWDSAAPVAVVTSAGLVATRLDGSPLEYNRPDASLPDLVICRPDLIELLRNLLGGIRPERATA